MELRVEYRYDPESHNWCFVVPSLGIVGGADTRERAEAQALEAVAFTLQGDDEDGTLADAEVGYFHVTLNR